jgi:kynurenine formamidase
VKRPAHALLAAVALGVLAVAALLGGRPSPAATSSARRWSWTSAARPPPTPAYANEDAEGDVHQPGFSLAATRWLIRERDLGALGTDTFGPDPGTDTDFRETSLVLHGHRMTLENLAGLDRMPPTGAWLVVGGPRNRAGSGAPSTILGLVP